MPTPIPWYKSSQIRVALTLFAPIAFRLLARTKVLQWVGVSLSLDNADVFVDWFLGVATASGGTFWIFKRVAAGNNPANQTPPIAPPAIVQTVKRLTDSVSKP